MKKILLFTSLLLSVLSISSVTYAESIVTDRPDFTESPSSVPPGFIQVEAGYTFAKADEFQEHTVGELLIRMPVSQRIEVRLALNSFAFSEASGVKVSGLQDSSIGLKAELIQMQNSLIPQTAIIVSTTLPTGGNPYREDTLQPGMKLCLGWDINEDWALSSNLNYDRASHSGTSFNEFSQSISLAWGFAEYWGAYLEVFSFQPDLAGSDDTSYINTGLTYLVTDDLQLDGRIGQGLNGLDTDYFVGIGVSNQFRI
jgi:hypothetical protein